VKAISRYVCREFVIVPVDLTNRNFDRDLHCPTCESSVQTVCYGNPLVSCLIESRD